MFTTVQNTVLKRCLLPGLMGRRFASTEPVIIEDRGRVRMIGINRPEKRNCINHEVATILRDEFIRFDEDPEFYVAVMHGVGGTFCAGYDLEQIASLSAVEDKSVLRDSIKRGLLGPTQMLLSKPVIGAIDGHAVAGGLELAIWCDMRVMEPDAVIGVYCRRFGIPLIDGGAVRLQKLIGMSRAMDMILTGRGVKGQEAFEFGLANKLVSKGTAVEEAFQLAKTISEFPQECLRADRAAAYYAAYSAKDYEDAMINEFEQGKHVLFSESIEGASSFANDGVGKHGKFQETN